MNMKRWILILTCLALLLALPACQKPEEGGPAEDEEEDASPSWQEQFDLGLRYLSEGNYEEAILAFTAVIEIDPNNALAYANRAIAYNSLGDSDSLELAAADYQKALELDDSLGEAWAGLADIRFEWGQYDEGLALLLEGREKAADVSAVEDALARHTELLLVTWMMRYQEYIDNGQYEEARDFLEECLAAGIDDGRLQEAMDELETLLAEEADDAMVAEAYDALGSDQYEDAVTTLEDQRGSFSDPEKYDNAMSDIQRLIAWVREGRTLTVVRTLEELYDALSQHPTDSVIVVRPGSVLKVPYNESEDPIGVGFEFRDLTNVAIWSDGSAQLLAESLYVPAVRLERCTDVLLHGLIMGHDPTVRGELGFECPAGSDVIYVGVWTSPDGSRVTIESCDLFGCGFCGVTSWPGSDVTVRDTVIHDCSMMIASIRGTGLFENCVFRNNAYSYENVIQYLDPFYVDMTAPCILPTGDQPVIFNNCVFEGNQHPKFTAPDSTAQFNGCTFADNAWEQNG